MDSGVKVVGAPAPPEESSVGDGPPDGRRGPRGSAASKGPDRFLVMSVLAAAGLVGTLVFGLLWAGSSGSGTQDAAVISTATTFLGDLTNFNAKTIDPDFAAITSMATGTFSGQANRFFNSTIRVDLEKALAESRGQVRSIYVQNDNGNQASVYAVVDQVYANNKIATPQTDVLRVVVNLQIVSGSWKISDVTVLEGATPATAGSASGSAGSVVPGQ
jgi:predicted lipid-binding transport protein (Tim44 family)